MTLLRQNQSPIATTSLADDVRHAVHLAASSKAPNTLRMYRSVWRSFTAYCDAHGLDSLPATHTTVAAYLSHLDAQGKTHSTATVHRAAIGSAHRLHNPPLDDPTGHALVQLVMDGIARTRGIAPRRQAVAILPDQIRAVIDSCDRTVEGIRDRAMLSLWYSAALRRSDVASLTSGSLQWHDRGVVVMIPYSKGDQKGRGQAVPLLTSETTQWLREWQALLDADSKRRGLTPEARPLFVCVRDGARLSAGACNAIFQRRAKMVGASGLSGHSLRAGLATNAARNGVGLLKISRRLRHKSVATTERYVRAHEQWDDAFEAPMTRTK